MASKVSGARKALHRGIAACGGLAVGLSGSALALNIGAPQTASYLTQPLLLRLPVSRDAGDPDISQYRVRLLPESAYQALGLPAPPHAALDFNVALEGDAQHGYWISIRSRHAIREPILSLLLEVRQPGSSWIRSIDLLLDPPPAAAAGSQLAAAPRPVAAPGASATTTPAGRGRATPVEPRFSGTYGPVRSGEVLSRISQRARPHAGVPIDRMAAALYELNRPAFDGSPHRLRAGVVLRVPDLATIEAMSSSLRWYEQDGRIAPAPTRSWQPAAATRPSEPRELRLRLDDRVYLRGQVFALVTRFDSYLALQRETLAATAHWEQAPRQAMFKVDWQLDPASVQPAAGTTAPVPDAPAPTETVTDPPLHTATDLGWEPELAADTAPVAPPAAERVAEGATPAAPAAREDGLSPRLVLGTLLLLLVGVVLALRGRMRSPPPASRPAVAYRQVSRPPARPAAEPAPAAPPPRQPEQTAEDDTGLSHEELQAIASEAHAAADRGLDFDTDAVDLEIPDLPAAAVLSEESEFEDDPQVQALHLRLTDLLAEHADPAVRREAKVALACLEAGDTDKAELIVETLEAQVGDTGTPGAGDKKVVQLKPRQHRQG